VRAFVVNVACVSKGAPHASRTSADICASVKAFQFVHHTPSAAATERA